jgi:hypothetical protein
VEPRDVSCSLLGLLSGPRVQRSSAQDLSTFCVSANSPRRAEMSLPTSIEESTRDDKHDKP